MRVRTFLLLLLAVALLACTPAASLRDLTGEESAAPQVRGVGHWLSGQLRPSPAAESLQPVQHAGHYPFGVNTFLQNETEPEKVERSLDLIAGAGFRWIRQEFTWEDLEVHHDDWFVDLRNNEIRNAWHKYDRIVELADARDIEIIARLSNPPAWSRAAGDELGAKAPPDHLSDYGDYVEAVVSRYAGRIQYFQIWNEPNCCEEWGTRPVSPEQYAELLREGYTRAKAANPDVVILTAPLAQTIEMDYYPGGLNDFLFLQRLYRAGGGDHFDILAINDYGLWSGPTDRRMRPRVINYSRALYLRDIMRRNGDGEKPIWISEMGWNSTPPDSGIPPSFGSVPESQRGPYLVEAFERQRQEWPWAGVSSVWFFKQATDEEMDQPQYYFRLLDPDFTPQPAWAVLTDYLASIEPVLYRGWHQEDHWALQAGMSPAPWTLLSDPGTVFGQSALGEAGQSLTVRLSGARASLLFPDLGATARFTVRVGDGDPQTFVLTAEGVSRGSSASSASHLRHWEEITLFELPLGFLPDGRTEVTITVTDGTLPLDGLIVE